MTCKDDDVSLDATTSVCSECLAHEASTKSIEANFEALHSHLEINPSVLQHHGAYDCLALLSGGKDSTYMLSLLAAHLDLRVLALTVDYGFLSSASWRNIARAVDALSMDHAVFRPSTRMCKPLYEAAVRTFGEICIGCEAVLTAGAFYSAVTQSIPILVWGMRSGQFRTEPAPVVVNDRDGWEKIRGRRLAPLLDNFAGFATGLDLRNLLEQVAVVDNSPDRLPLSFFPLLGQLDTEAMAEGIRALGWEKPEDVGGFSTNCAANHLHIYIKKQRYDDRAYRRYLSGSIREGLISKAEAQTFLETPCDAEAAKEILETLGMNDDLDQLAADVKYPRSCLC